MKWLLVIALIDRPMSAKAVSAGNRRIAPGSAANAGATQIRNATREWTTQMNIDRAMERAESLLFRAVADKLLAAIEVWENADDQPNGRSKADLALIAEAEIARKSFLRARVDTQGSETK